MKHRILAIASTNTRQTTAALDVLLRVVGERDDVEVVRWELETATGFPYPWGFYRFFSIFPDCINRTPAALVPPPAEVTGDFDCVLLAYPVWFLSEALPMQAFLQSEHAQLLRGKPVISLITCRNMWFNAGLEVFARIRELDGKLTDSIVLQDRGAPWTTFITTPVWLLWGRKQFWRFPQAGILQEDIDGIERLSKAWSRELDTPEPYAEPMFAELDSVAIESRYLFPELVLKRVVFRPWAWGIAAVTRVLPFLKRPLIYVFFVALLASVLLLIPVLIVTRIVLLVFMRPVFERMVDAVKQPYSKRDSELSEPARPPA